MQKLFVGIISFLFILMCVSCEEYEKDPSFIFLIILVWVIALGIPILVTVKKKRTKREKNAVKKEIAEENKINEDIELKLLNYYEVIDVIGEKENQWNSLTFQQSYSLGFVKYIGGIEFLDEIINNQNIDREKSNIEFHIKGLEIIIHLSSLDKYHIALSSYNIQYWTIESQKDIIGNKSKSVVGRAMVDGILFGPAGAIVGGMTGLGGKRVTISGVDNIISISCNDMGKEKMILFSCKDSKLQKVYDIFKNSTFGNKFKSPSELIPYNQTETRSEFSLADEIKKLKDLLDEDILTKEEFEKQKQKLLNK